jgi:hypothetical protein
LDKQKEQSVDGVNFVVFLIWTAMAFNSAPYVDEDTDEFYGRVDSVEAPFELKVTILDVWNPVDKRYGPRWPHGKQKVKQIQKKVVLDDLVAPRTPDEARAVIDFIRESIKTDNEIIVSGGAVYLHKDWPRCLNTELVRQGLVATTNPFEFQWMERAKAKKIGIWRDKAEK